MTQLQRLETKLQKLNRQLARYTAKGIVKALRSVVVNLIIAIAKTEEIINQVINAVKIRTLTLDTPRRAWRAWVAKINAKRDTVHGGFSKEFIEPTSREFGRKGETSATFEIEVDLNQIYQDSDGDFWMFENTDGKIRTICYQEVQYIFSQIPF
jgi:hypothetical protein